ncbi:MAG: ribosome biogenesis GTPase YlqF [Oscillospiraceae bacterium]|nr:ribosome biogenesis GTPase YlqF [Oscillospiraceae bacterium]
MAEMKDIQWFPGHMTKTRRMIQANLSLVDGVVEILDARIPVSSRNPEMDRLVKGKPRMLILNKADMADSNATEKWIGFYKSKGFTVIKCNCKTGDGIKAFLPAVKNQMLKELMDKRRAKGIEGAPLRLMIVGIPNVGKSSFINRMAKSKKAKVEDRPGVTRTKQWVKLGDNVEMLDMPGVLWPKFEDQEVARRLAFTGAVKDDILDKEALASFLLENLAENYAGSLVERYKIEIPDKVDDDMLIPGGIARGFEILENVGRKRGMLISGGEVNTERAAITVLDEFRSGKLGRITLEMPQATEGENESAL